MEFAPSFIEFPIWLAVFFELRSLVPTWRMMWLGLIFLIVGFVWFYIHLIFSKLNYPTLTRYLCLIFFARYKPLTFLTMLSPRKKTICFHLWDDAIQVWSMLLLSMFLLSLCLVLLCNSLLWSLVFRIFLFSFFFFWTIIFF